MRSIRRQRVRVEFKQKDMHIQHMLMIAKPNYDESMNKLPVSLTTVTKLSLTIAKLSLTTAK